MLEPNGLDDGLMVRAWDPVRDPGLPDDAHPRARPRAADQHWRTPMKSIT